MKKILLFAIAFLGAITFTFAQSEATVTDAEDTETFTFGANKNLQDASIVAITAGVGSAQTNKNGWLGILSDAIEVVPATDPVTYTSTDDTQGTFTFDVKTTSANLYGQITLAFKRRIANTVTGSVDVAGTQAATISWPSDGVTTANTLEDVTVVLNNVALTPTAKTITVNMDQLLIGSQTAAGVPTLRIYSVAIAKSIAVLGVDDNNTVNNIGLYPNPVTNSFQIDASIDIENVQLYNIAGQLLKTFNKGANYDISDLATGIYTANIKTVSGSKTIKIMKK